ncbi:hypothetical protein VTO73DRAFT_265 [Trametes versicolor]
MAGWLYRNRENVRGTLTLTGLCLHHSPSMLAKTYDSFAKQYSELSMAHLQDMSANGSIAPPAQLDPQSE